MSQSQVRKTKEATVLEIIKQGNESDYFGCVQDAAAYVSAYLRGISGALKRSQTESVLATSGLTKYSGRITYKESQSFTDSHNRIARECFLHIGYAAIGSVQALEVAAAARLSIFGTLKQSVPGGVFEEKSLELKITMPDGDLRLRSEANGARIVMHMTACYAPFSRI